MLGILCGLIGALGQTFSYIATRRFLMAEGRSSQQLMVIGHVWLCLCGVLLLPFVWIDPVQGWGLCAPLAGTTGAYLAGQFFLFQTVKLIPPSRVAPLLGIKILILSINGLLFFDTHLNLHQWGAVLLTVIAAVGLNFLGARLSLKAWCLLIATVTCYSLSDLCIIPTIEAVDTERSFRGVMTAISLKFIAGIIYSLCFFPQLRRAHKSAWYQALPFSVCWCVGMIGLFAANALLGVVAAVIVQNARGPFSIIVGRCIGSRGGLEQPLTWSLAAKQIAATLLLVVAIAWYQWAASAS